MKKIVFIYSYTDLEAKTMPMIGGWGGLLDVMKKREPYSGLQLQFSISKKKLVYLSSFYLKMCKLFLKNFTERVVISHNWLKGH